MALRFAFLRAGLDPGQRGFDRRADPGEVALEQIIGGPGLHAPDRRFLVHRPGHDQERDRRRPLPRQGERGHAVEARKGVVGENQVGMELVDLAEEFFAGIDATCIEWYPGPLELVFHQLSVHGHVFENQDPQALSRHSCSVARPVLARLPGVDPDWGLKGGDLGHKL
jgi:hypothetical protein